MFVPNEDNVYVMCGFNGKEIESCHHFDVATKTWRTLKSTPGARSVFAGVNMNGRYVVFGGEVDPGTQGHLGSGTMREDVALFDPRDESWTPVKCEGTHRPCGRGWMEMARLTANRVLLLGGLSSDNERLADGYILTLHF